MSAKVTEQSDFNLPHMRKAEERSTALQLPPQTTDLHHLQAQRVINAQSKMSNIISRRLVNLHRKKNLELILKPRRCALKKKKKD